MSGVLSRLTKLALMPETLGSQGTYVAPGAAGLSVPFNTAKFTDTIDPLRDESMRANDAIVQGIQQGPWQTGWELDVNLYSDLAGYLFRGMIGADTVTAGVSTTLASNCSAGAASLTLSVTMPSPNIIQISDTGGANLEWVAVTVSGTTATVTTPGGTKFAHTAAGGAVLSQSTHVFKQNRTFSTQWPSYSFTVDDGTEQTGWPGQVLGELGIKIDPKGYVGLSAKYTGWPSIIGSPVTTFSYAASAVLAAAGWTWTVTNAGASSTRGVTMDITMKRAIEVILGSDGTQGPREVFAGALEADGAYKAVFDTPADKNLFIQYSQLPTVHTITKPMQSGGESLAVTMSQSGYTTGEVDLGSEYIQLSQSLSAIANATDTGIAQVALKNYRSTAY